MIPLAFALYAATDDAVPTPQANAPAGDAMAIDTDPNKLTDPEWRAARERAQASEAYRDLMHRIQTSCACFCCTRRDRASETWDGARCGLARPATYKGPGCKFDPDTVRIAPTYPAKD